MLNFVRIVQSIVKGAEWVGLGEIRERARGLYIYLFAGRQGQWRYPMVGFMYGVTMANILVRFVAPANGARGGGAIRWLRPDCGERPLTFSWFRKWLGETWDGQQWGPKRLGPIVSGDFTSILLRIARKGSMNMLGFRRLGAYEKVVEIFFLEERSIREDTDIAWVWHKTIALYITYGLWRSWRSLKPKRKERLTSISVRESERIHMFSNIYVSQRISSRSKRPMAVSTLILWMKILICGKYWRGWGKRLVMDICTPYVPHWGRSTGHYT